jgi:hypothetical protein
MPWRGQTIEVLRPASGTVLATNVTAFSGGQCWVWQVSRPVPGNAHGGRQSSRQRRISRFSNRKYGLI